MSEEVFHIFGGDETEHALALSEATKLPNNSSEQQSQSGVPRGGQKGSLSGGPGFRFVRFRMQNSSAQTSACGHDDVF